MSMIPGKNDMLSCTPDVRNCAPPMMRPPRKSSSPCMAARSEELLQELIELNELFLSGPESMRRKKRASFKGWPVACAVADCAEKWCAATVVPHSERRRIRRRKGMVGPDRKGFSRTVR